MNKAFFDKTTPKGIVYRRKFNAPALKEMLEAKTGLNFDEAYRTIDVSEVLFNGEPISHSPKQNKTQRVLDFDVLCMMGLQVVKKEEFAEMVEKSARKQFADNWLWKALHKVFNVDLVIPHITGVWTLKPIKANLVTNVGHAAYAGQFGGSTSAAFTAMAYGTGATAAAVTDTALQTEVARAASTISRVTTSVTNDTFQSVHTFTAGGTQAITEEGILDNNVSGGNLAAHNVFSAVNMIINDTLQFTHQIQS